MSLVTIPSAFSVLCLLLCIAGVAFAVDVRLQDKDSGFFLKPLSSKEDPFTTLNKRLVITKPVRQHSQVSANAGPFTATDHITRPMMRASLGNHSQVLQHSVLDDLDISVHLVSRTITHQWPILQALFHASQLSEQSYSTSSKDKKFGQKNSKKHKVSTSTTTSTTTESPMPFDQPEPKWCLQLHVQKSGEEIRSSCLLDRVSPATCLSQVVIPPGWWQVQQSSVSVYYSVINVSKSLVCPSSANSIVPTKTHDDKKLDKIFVGTVTLSRGKLPYREVQEDQHILVYIPQRSFSPGTRFTVPVKLQAESDVNSFSVRARARKGLRVVGIEASNAEVWHVNSNINRKHKNAVVSASVKDKASYAKTDKKQEIFQWIFQVESDVKDTDVGRILLSIEYEMRSSRMEAHDIKKRVVVRVHIQQDQIHNIVPVIKTTELINTAVLSGHPIHHKVEIYGVTKSGRIMDITNKTTCHSGNNKVLQVHPRCQTVFLSGEETNGSTTVNIIAKYNSHTKFLFFTVWYPELPVVIELTDHRLSQIKGWKAPKFNQHISRKTRGLDFGYVQHPSRILSKHSAQLEDLSTTCHLRFQQSVLKVFAKLKAPDATRKNMYFLGRRASFDVTHLVQDTLRIADTSIATLDGSVITGAKPGRTEVQVVSTNGRCIGAKDIKVGNDKVTVKKLEVTMVTGLTISLMVPSELPGTIVASTTLDEHLSTKYQQGVLDIAIKFSDNTTLPLHYVPPQDYFLDMATMNNKIVSFAPMLYKDQPKVIALGQGKGELLKISLELGDACQRKTTKPLSSKLIDINIDFSRNNRTDGAMNDHVVGNGGHILKNHQVDTVNHEDHQPEEKKPAETLSKTAKIQDVPSADVGVSVDNSAVHEAQMQYISDTRHLTPLEVGMYALLGVFCLAITVFMVNCGVFIMKYRKKKMIKADTTVSSHDWVWIGSATLERNAVNTQCSRALMTEEDFNGNQSRTPPGRRGSNRNSACSSTSNRNSYISTYKGSECSIRITANPLPDAPAPAAPTTHLQYDKNGNTEPNPATTHLQQQQPLLVQQPPQQQPTQSAAPMSRRGSGLLTNPNARPHSGMMSTMPSTAAKNASASAHATDGNTTVASSSCNDQQVKPVGGPLKKNSQLDFTWDYESMGLNYNQLMEYFDNLKESTA